MALKDDLEKEVAAIFRGAWTEREGTKVPDETTLSLTKNEGVNLDAAILYADLSESTNLVDGYKKLFAAEIYTTYLRCAAKIINAQGGTITAYDGDRIMAVFLGGSKCTEAVKTGLKINYACKNIIQPAIKNQYPNTSFTLKQAVGVDTSKVFVTRAGVRGANDLVWIGRAANYAAKLSSESYTSPTWITKAVYDLMNESCRTTKGQNMWKSWQWSKMNNIPVYSSTWWWAL